MKEKFKEVFEKFYKNLSENYLSTFNTKPMISYNRGDVEIDEDMIISEPDEDGDAIWEMKEIGDYDFSSIEEKIGFSLCEELKAYFSTYLFLYLAGYYKDITLYFDPLKSKEYIEKKVLVAQKDGTYYFNGTEIFALGIAVYKNDDSYVIFYDNKTGKVFIYENDTENKVEFNESLLEILNNLNASF